MIFVKFFKASAQFFMCFLSLVRFFEGFYLQFFCCIFNGFLIKGRNGPTLYGSQRTALAPAAQNELTGEATKRERHVRDSALLMKCTEYMGHETLLIYA
jgi:hypothetical protein